MERGQTANARVFLRADGSLDIGLGHVMRCLTLGEALATAGASVTLVSTALVSAMRIRASRCGVQVLMSPASPGSVEDAEFIARYAPDLVVVDGYFFTPEFHRALDVHRIRVMAVDDNGENAPENAAVILNANPHASGAMYERQAASGARLLLGTDYLLIRSEVQSAAADSPDLNREPTVLVAVGGTDVLQLTTPLVERLTRSQSLTVLAPSLQNPSSGERAIPEIAGMLASCRVAVIGAGSTLWEACVVGTPPVALIVADNQEAGARAAEALGAATVFDCRADVPFTAIASAVSRLGCDGTARANMILAGRALVDGAGASRVARSVLCQLQGGALS